jgi:aconitate hydratase 2/2-methylisocitrate dehydratase
MGSLMSSRLISMVAAYSALSSAVNNSGDRLGDDADVYLSSAEVAAIAAKLGRIPTVEEYLSAMQGTLISSLKQLKKIERNQHSNCIF